MLHRLSPLYSVTSDLERSWSSCDGHHSSELKTLKTFHIASIMFAFTLRFHNPSMCVTLLEVPVVTATPPFLSIHISGCKTNLRVSPGVEQARLNSYLQVHSSSRQVAHRNRGHILQLPGIRRKSACWGCHHRSHAESC
jgi:hypothetical protein